MINNVVLMGRLTFEPELKVTPSGVSVIHFQIAVDRDYQKPGEERKADFIDITAWRQTAEFVSKYFHKGSMIALEGSITTDNYKDNDGNKRKRFSVLAAKVSFCGAKTNTEKNTNPAYSQPMPPYASASNSDFEEIIDDEDSNLPF